MKINKNIMHYNLQYYNDITHCISIFQGNPGLPGLQGAIGPRGYQGITGEKGNLNQLV